jgi:hypothetical protein
MSHFLAHHWRSHVLAHTLIQGIGGANRSSIGLVLGRIPQPSFPHATGAVHLGDTSNVDGSEGALRNPENHTFGLPIIGCASSLLPRRVGVRAHMLEVIWNGRRFQCHRRPPRWLQYLRVRHQLEGTWIHYGPGKRLHLQMLPMTYSIIRVRGICR